MKAFVVKSSESVAFDRGPEATTYKMVYDEMGKPIRTLSFGRTIIEPGGKYILHRHNVEEGYYILRGRGYVEVENERYEFETGDAVFIEANVKHQTFNSDPHEPLEFFYVGGITLAGCRERDIEKWAD